MKVLIDCDGTICPHNFPEIGEDIGAAPVLRDLVKKGHELILFTMRSDKVEVEVDHPGLHPVAGPYLTMAIKWFKNNGIELHGVNKCPGQEKWTESPKAYGHLIIDDTSLGIPLVDKKIKTWEKGWLPHHPALPYSDRPYVDWLIVRTMLEERGIL